jgi:hypothetical protein
MSTASAFMISLRCRTCTLYVPLPLLLMPCLPCPELRSNSPLMRMIAGADWKGMPEEWIGRRVEHTVMPV